MKQIPLVNSDKVAIVDDHNYDRLMEFSWNVLRPAKGGHCIRAVGTDYKTLAGIIKGDCSVMYDHIDRDPYNNLENNLRIATAQQNAFNRGKRAGTSSKYKGVTWDKPSGKWMAQIKYSGFNYKLGRFKLEVDAAKAYNLKATDLFGEFAVLNDV